MNTSAAIFEAVYSSQGGAPLGFRCKVKIKRGTVSERYCNKLCKSYRGMLQHGFRKHNLKLQMELFDAQEAQHAANKLFTVRNADGGANPYDFAADDRNYDAAKERGIFRHS